MSFHKLPPLTKQQHRVLNMCMGNKSSRRTKLAFKKGFYAGIDHQTFTDNPYSATHKAEWDAWLHGQVEGYLAGFWYRSLFSANVPEIDPCEKLLEKLGVSYWVWKSGDLDIPTLEGEAKFKIPYSEARKLIWANKHPILPVSGLVHNYSGHEMWATGIIPEREVAEYGDSWPWIFVKNGG